MPAQHGKPCGFLILAIADPEREIVGQQQPGTEREKIDEPRMRQGHGNGHCEIDGRQPRQRRQHNKCRKPDMTQMKARYSRGNRKQKRETCNIGQHGVSCGWPVPPAGPFPGSPY